MYSKTVSVDLIHILLKYASSIGISSDDICLETELDGCVLKNTDVRVPINKYLAVWKAIENRAKDKCFGLHYGEATCDLFRGNILCTVMMNCQTIGEALYKFIKYYGLMSDLIIPHIAQQNELANFTWHPANQDIKCNKHLSDSFLIMLSAILRCLTGYKINIIEVQFGYQQPDNIDEYSRIFGPNLSFDNNEYTIIFSSKILSEPIFLANPKLLITYEQVAEKFLERLLSSKIWTDKVITILSKNIINGNNFDIESIANHLAISTRNLQYRLKEEGITFRTLVDQVRKEIAIDCMNKADINLYDVAFLLGFSEQSSFNHAFKKWTGSTPSEYRRNL